MTLTDPNLRAAVQGYLQDRSATVIRHETLTLGNGFADQISGGDGLVLHQGIADTSSGQRPFRLVSKQCRVHPGGEDPDSWLYWKREAQAYASGILSQLPDGLRAPDCYEIAYPGPESATIFIEALDETSAPWTMEDHRAAARSLGHLNAHFLGKIDPTANRWMAPGRAWSWLSLADPLLGTLPERREDPVLRRWLAGDNFARTLALRAEVPRLKTALQDMPLTFCHHDAFCRNILRCDLPDGGRELVAIDWAFAGFGVLGEDLAAAFAVPLLFGDVPLEQHETFEGALLAGYLEGLHAGGWSGDPDLIRFGFYATTAMTFALGALGTWHPLLSDPDMEPIIENIAGTSADNYLGRVGSLQDRFLHMGETALQLL